MPPRLVRLTVLLRSPPPPRDVLAEDGLVGDVLGVRVRKGPSRAGSSGAVADGSPSIPWMWRRRSPTTQWMLLRRRSPRLRVSVMRHPQHVTSIQLWSGAGWRGASRPCAGSTPAASPHPWGQTGLMQPPLELTPKRPRRRVRSVTGVTSLPAMRLQAPGALQRGGRPPRGHRRGPPPRTAETRMSQPVPSPHRWGRAMICRHRRRWQGRGLRRRSLPRKWSPQQWSPQLRQPQQRRGRRPERWLPQPQQPQVGQPQVGQLQRRAPQVRPRQRSQPRRRQLLDGQGQRRAIRAGGPLKSRRLR